MSLIELRNHIHDAITFNNKSVLQIMSTVLPKETLLFRVRDLKDSSIPNRDMSKRSDAWNPPVGNVKQRGRLNKLNESLLYVSPDCVLQVKSTQHCNENIHKLANRFLFSYFLIMHG